ncbi:TetR family transcriptional regulator [Plantibacter flavus]|uniref:TetR family transcriptional regulator n=1 Tax=Plantibacter flavus TaxID=150123 RepID=UPI003F1833CA
MEQTPHPSGGARAVLEDTADDAPSPDLRRRRREATLREIAAAALELFEERGVSGTTVDDIARAVGISPRTFFRYFATKEESVLGLHEDFDRALAERLSCGADPDAVLSQVEAVYEDAVSEFGEPGAPELDVMMRTRRLINREPALQSAAFTLDCQANIRLQAIVTARLPQDTDPVVARLAVETAATTMRIAFDEWTARIEAGEAVGLSTVYRRTRDALRRLTAGT